LGALAACRADTIICLCERHELDQRYPAYVSWLGVNEGQRATWFPVPDLHAPPVAEVLPFLAQLRQLVQAGQGVLMHCGAGIGRAGTLAAALLMRMGVDRTHALAIVAKARPLAGPEAGAQTEVLEDLATALPGPTVDGSP
jgi:protein-tyrosine phosphatase